MRSEKYTYNQPVIVLLLKGQTSTHGSDPRVISRQKCSCIANITSYTELFLMYFVIIFEKKMIDHSDFDYSDSFIMFITTT